MNTRSVTKIAGILLAASVMSGAFGLSVAEAQTAVPAEGCFVDPARMPEAEISAFLASPDSLLAQFASGGLPLSNQARSLAGSSADALPVLIALAAKANASQSAAIGAGLARAARACAGVNADYAAMIQDAVAGSENRALETAFLAGGNETQTAAIGGGLSGGGSATTGGAGAIGGGGSPGGGSNGGAGATTAAGSGTSSFSGGGSGGYYANDRGGSTTVYEASRTTASF